MNHLCAVFSSSLLLKVCMRHWKNEKHAAKQKNICYRLNRILYLDVVFYILYKNNLKYC